jgi:hypothetical protein
MLSTWIGDVLQGAETWISTDDIDKGSLWFGDISTQLAGTSVGILCLTPENVTAPWVLFEAGALSKGLPKGRVCPLLVNLGHTDLKPPLSQFNGTLPTKEDMLKLILTINSQNDDKTIAVDKVQKAFNLWWDEFDSKFAAILKGYKPVKKEHRRPTEDVLEEILEISRSLQKASQQSSAMNPIFVFEPGMEKPLSLQRYVENELKDESSVYPKWLLADLLKAPSHVSQLKLLDLFSKVLKESKSEPSNVAKLKLHELWSALPKESKSESEEGKTEPEKGKSS